MTLAMAGAYIVAPHLCWQKTLLFAGQDEALQLPAGMTKSSIKAMTTVAAARINLFGQPLTQIEPSAWLYDAEGHLKRDTYREIA